jgi:uncharacterized ubiquitin-like protein YukD
MKTVTVKFDNYNGKTYDYLVDNNTKVQVGNHAVAHNGAQFAIVQVVEVSAGVSAKANKSLVLVFNDTIINEYLERNKKVLEQKALFTRLDQLIDQEYENNKYRVLAASNAEAAEILAKLGIK